MLFFHIVASLSILGTLLWFWGQRQSRLSLLPTLLILLGLEVVQAAVFAFTSFDNIWFWLILRLLAWAILLRLATPQWQLIAPFLLLLFVITLPWALGSDLANWGYVTAVPLLTLLAVRPEPQSQLPIIAPHAHSPVLRPVSVSDAVTADMIQSQQPILEYLTEGIIFSGQTGSIDYVNQAASIMLEMTQQEMLGHPVTDVLAHLPMLGGASNKNHFEMNGRMLEGQMSIVYNQAGVAQGTVAILRDITARHQAETTRDDFLTTVSHELRTPLTAIKGYVGLLASGAGGDIAPTQTKFLETIQRNVNHMVQLINSLIFATTIRSGRLEYGAGPTDLNQLVSQLAREAQSKGIASEQQINLTLAENLPPVQADPLHMETVITELLQNALNYNRPDGTIQVTTSLEGDGAPGQTFAVVTIRDEGIGIAAADRDRIFEEFYRPDKSSTQVQAGGMGMGLSIVRALIEAYNGRIWFDTMPDQGTTFTFIIPIHQLTPSTLT